MTKDTQPIATSLRIPVDLLRQVDELKKEQHLDRTAIIVQAVAYWCDVHGRATSDNEYLQRLENMEKRLDELQKHIDRQDAELNAAHKIIEKQSNTIDTLLGKL